ncbi:GT2 family glycosyltransferase [Sphingomonas sp. BE138]|uniref:glycosyltransferase family 2 protein n=1 Tax=Sphingomonas sp. BE138 TaxID=2817845 RepID=UPI00285F87CA|nr:glycosyltransferase [Sphingomonas sp. BE138]MDR6788488.1 GT2 family glycosyltransferase [Sphingomonas sp. BE138]
MTIRFSVVVLTYARDQILSDTLQRLAMCLGVRDDYEVILVDNNPEPANREALLERFAHRRYLHSGENKGVRARNDGFDAATGAYIVLLDDDVLVETPAMLDLFAARFDEDERLGAITVRKHVRGETRRRVDLIPHTAKDVDLTQTFLTFRFVGGCVAFRAACLREVGGFLPDFFYGLEEIELSYRIIDAGWRIRYDPAVACEELEHPAGRDAKKRVQTQRLANKYIISYLRMPFPEVLVNAALFTPYLLMRQRGQASVVGAVKQFLAWRARSDRPPRKAISRATADYIRQCGGSVWR